MKEKILVLIIVFVTIVSFYALASSVTVIDKDNVIVTNDFGTSSQYTIEQINAIVKRDRVKVSLDQQSLLSDQETYGLWMDVQNQALNAVNSYQSNND